MRTIRSKGRNPFFIIQNGSFDFSVETETEFWEKYVNNNIENYWEEGSGNSVGRKRKTGREIIMRARARKVKASRGIDRCI